jgi:hypothetical protein
MLTREQFDAWFVEYRSRWPSVGDYAAKQPLPGVLLDTWYASMAAFDASVLEAVTAGMISGDFEPVEPMKFGTWSSEIRRMCRQVVARRRDRAEADRRRSESVSNPFDPIKRGSMADMYHAACAVYELIPGADDCVVKAAIVLADDHTDCERERAMNFLAGAGLTWSQIQAVADRIKSRGGREVIPTVAEEAA